MGRQKSQKTLFFQNLIFLHFLYVFWSLVWFVLVVDTYICELRPKNRTDQANMVQILIFFPRFRPKYGIFWHYFFLFHAISPVLMLILYKFIHFGYNYTIKIGARLGRTISSAHGGLSKIGSERGPKIDFFGHWRPGRPQMACTSWTNGGTHWNTCRRTALDAKLVRKMRPAV